MARERRFVGYPLILVGLFLVLLGLREEHRRAFLGSGSALVVVGVAIAARQRRLSRRESLAERDEAGF